jgi:hypothetical protein
LHELAGIDAESVGDLEQVVQVEVAPAALDLAQEGPVDTAPCGQGFLAESQGFAVRTDALAEGLSCRREGDRVPVM